MKAVLDIKDSKASFVMELLGNYQDSLSQLCRKHRVHTLYAFGSVLTDRFDNNSDVDLIVAFEDMPVNEYADNYFDFKFSLQDIFNRPVDLLEEQAIRNPFFLQTVNRTKQRIYG